MPILSSTQPSDDAGKDEMIARNAKAGHSFAQFALGQSFHTKWARNAEDVEAEEQTVYWLTLASEKGEIGAQYMLGFMWYSGATTTITKSNGKAMEILLPAARRGHATAQYTCGQILWEQGVRNGEEWVWFTLAAAQGQAHAQERLGDIFPESTDDNDDSDNSLVEAFKGAYWTRKAALQGRRKAQSALAALVFALKEELFDGVTNHVGYSCIPEVLFWKRQLAAANAGGRSMTGWPTAYDAYTEESCVQSCACCGKKARDDTRGMAGAIAAGKASESPSVIKIKRCLQCRSVGYCSSECQKKHWKMGHKVDCLYAVALQKEYKKKYFSNIAW
jgi:MYND finger